MPPGVFSVQAAQPLAAKLLSGAQNVSFQANATADAARQAVLDAQQKLSALKLQLQTAKAARKAATSVFKAAPASWGKAQFKVSVDLAHSSGKHACIYCVLSTAACHDVCRTDLTSSLQAYNRTCGPHNMQL